MAYKNHKKEIDAKREWRRKNRKHYAKYQEEYQRKMWCAFRILAKRHPQELREIINSKKYKK